LVYFGKGPDGQEVGRLEQPNAVPNIEAHSGVQLLRDVEKTGAGETGMH